METLEREIKQLIIDTLRLEGVVPEGIDSAAPLFGEGLGLDSIDALELAMVLRKRYGFRTSQDDAKNRQIFGSVRSLAEYIQLQKQAEAG